MLAEAIVPLVQEAQRAPNKMDPERPTPRHIIVKMPTVKYKEKILKATREKQLVIYRRVSIRLTADFSKETLQTIRDWQETSKVMKSKDLHPRLLCPANLSFRIKGASQTKEKTKRVHYHQTSTI